MARRFRKRQDEEQTYWLSYSDMMAGLLLTFVLIIAVTVLHANIQFDMKQEELLGKEEQLMIQADALEKEQALVEEQQSKLSIQASQLEDQAEKLTLQRKQLTEQEDLLNRQSALLEELQKVMDSQQEKLDRIIGVRSELIEALKEEFDDSSLQISVDENTGAITMDSQILFEYNQDELKETGQAFLAEFLPRYASILLSPTYSEYVSEIIIEGHTDTTGNYLFNLDLSQKRAYSVAAYCMSEENHILDAQELEAMRQVLSSTGKSFSEPVYKADGTVDAEASRRVEILFRLKDEEMIREMIEILNAEQVNEQKIQIELADAPGT
ncbi:MAG: OmpA family protein [Lachnospiraceae bacterium]|nr:OmpA family protein [Lachnospiraceae bacterium]